MNQKQLIALCALVALVALLGAQTGQCENWFTRAFRSKGELDNVIKAIEWNIDNPPTLGQEIKHLFTSGDDKIWTKAHCHGVKHANHHEECMRCLRGLIDQIKREYPAVKEGGEYKGDFSNRECHIRFDYKDF